MKCIDISIIGHTNTQIHSYPISLKGKLGEKFYWLNVFIGLKLREVSTGNFYRKAPKLVKNHVKGSKIDQIRTKQPTATVGIHPISPNSYCRNPPISPKSYCRNPPLDSYTSCWPELVDSYSSCWPKLVDSYSSFWLKLAVWFLFGQFWTL